MTRQTAIQADAKAPQRAQARNALDTLDPAAVIDVWVRGKFMSRILDHNGVQFLRSQLCEHVQQRLSDNDDGGIYEAAAIGLGADHAVTQALSDRDSQQCVRWLFDQLAGEADEQTAVEVAREEIDAALRDDARRITVMRDRIAHHVDEAADEPATEGSVEPAAGIAVTTTGSSDTAPAQAADHNGGVMHQPT